MGELFEKLCDIKTLDDAWRHVRRKKVMGGLDGVQPDDLEKDIKKTLNRLHDDLINKKYVPVPYRKGAMPKFNEKNEWRSLSLPSVVDKIVQQAFLDVVGPFFERDFMDCSFAYRRGKGSIKAVKQVEYILSSYNVQWTVSMDIDNFFDTMSHDFLNEQISAKIREPELLNLVSLWLNAGIISARGAWDDPEEGIAQGSVVSPLFSNIYLHCLDKFAVENSFLYVRYSDNFIILSEHKDTLYSHYEQIKNYIENHLKLRLNDDPYPFKDVQSGFVFLGIFFKGNIRKISTGKEKKIFRKLNWLTDRDHQSDPETFIKLLNDSVSGTKRYYSFINPNEQFELFDNHLIERLKFLFVHFRKRGLLRSKDQVLSLLFRVQFYINRPLHKRQSLCGTLAGEIEGIVQQKETEKEEPEKKEVARKKKQTAQKSKYLKKVAVQSEIVVSTSGTFIGKTGRRIIVRQQRKNVLDIPFSKIKYVTINTSGVTFSSDLVFQCSQSKIPITFYTYSGKPYAVLQSPQHSMGTVSVLQIRAYETEKALEFVKKLLSGKSRNQVNLLKFYLRSRKNTHSEFAYKVRKNTKKMLTLVKDINAVELKGIYSVTRDRLFTLEAQISALYWDCMKLCAPPELGFVKRVRQNATDVVNNMLNYGYGILYQRVWQAVLKVGLNPHVSFLHAFQTNKPTLVYDLVEEYRQPFIDRSLFNILTKGKRGKDLKMDKKTGLLSKETKEQVIKAVLSRLSGLITFRGKKIKCEDVIEIQTKNVVSFLEGKEKYRPFIFGY